MKISPRQAEAFVRNPPPETRAVLLYGPDIGLVHERTAILTRSVVDNTDDVFRYVELSATQIRSDPARIVDEAFSQSLGGGRRVIVVTDAGDTVTDGFRNLFEHPGLTDPETGLVLARGGDLGGRSSLRKLFEPGKAAAAVACYADNEEALHRLVNEVFRENDISAEAGVINFIVDNLGSDRQLNRREIEKFALYAGSGTTVSIDDAAACVGDRSEAALDDVVLAATDGDYRALDKALERAWSEGLSPVALLRAAQRHFQRLHIVSAQAASTGRSIDDAMKSLRPPVFWKVAAKFRRQAGLWHPHPIEMALDRLTEAEILVKSTGIPDRSACARAMMAVTQLARTAQR